MAKREINPEGVDQIRALYQLVMADLEPDLLLENIGNMKQKYMNETAEEKAARKARYAVALPECFRRMHIVIDQMKKDMHNFKHLILDEYKQKEGQERDEALHNLEDSLNDL